MKQLPSGAGIDTKLCRYCMQYFLSNKDFLDLAKDKFAHNWWCETNVFRQTYNKPEQVPRYTCSTIRLASRETHWRLIIHSREFSIGFCMLHITVLPIVSCSNQCLLNDSRLKSIIIETLSNLRYNVNVVPLWSSNQTFPNLAYRLSPSGTSTGELITCVSVQKQKNLSTFIMWGFKKNSLGHLVNRILVYAKC